MLSRKAKHSFNPNFAHAREHLIAQPNDLTTSTPPLLGYFLWLDNTPFFLLDGENLTLL
jgi:hypothetical protein